MEKKKRIAFIRPKAWPLANRIVEGVLKEQFPDHEVDVVDVSTLVKKRPHLILVNSIATALLYGNDILQGWKKFRLAFWRTPYIFRQIRRLVRSSLAHTLEEAIGAHRIVKVFGGEDYESRRLRAASDRLRSVSARQSAALALGTPINQLIISVAVSAILWVAIRQSVAGQYGPGDFITYIFALLNLMNQVKTLSNVTGTIQRGRRPKACSR